jgi:hypothetical protein
VRKPPGCTPGAAPDHAALDITTYMHLRVDSTDTLHVSSLIRVYRPMWLPLLAVALLVAPLGNTLISPPTELEIVTVMPSMPAGLSAALQALGPEIFAGLVVVGLLLPGALCCASSPCRRSGGVPPDAGCTLDAGPMLWVVELKQAGVALGRCSSSDSGWSVLSMSLLTILWYANFNILHVLS